MTRTMSSLDLTRLSDSQYRQYLMIQEWSSANARRCYDYSIGKLQVLGRGELTDSVLDFIRRNPGLMLSEILEGLKAGGDVQVSRPNLRYLLDQLCDRNLCTRYRQGRCYHYEAMQQPQYLHRETLGSFFFVLRFNS